jgi:hypothetical protein
MHRQDSLVNVGVVYIYQRIYALLVGHAYMYATHATMSVKRERIDP